MDFVQADAQTQCLKQIIADFEDRGVTQTSINRAKELVALPDEEEKLAGYTAQEWMKAVVDLLDGDSRWYEIQEATGWDEKRSRELEAMYEAAIQE